MNRIDSSSKSVQKPRIELESLPELEELTIPEQYQLYGDRLFYEEDNCLYSIQLPSSIKKFNNKKHLIK